MEGWPPGGSGVCVSSRQVVTGSQWSAGTACSQLELRSLVVQRALEDGVSPASPPAPPGSPAAPHPGLQRGRVCQHCVQVYAAAVLQVSRAPASDSCFRINSKCGTDFCTTLTYSSSPGVTYSQTVLAASSVSSAWTTSTLVAAFTPSTAHTPPFTAPNPPIDSTPPSTAPTPSTTPTTPSTTPPTPSTTPPTPSTTPPTPHTTAPSPLTTPPTPPTTPPLECCSCVDMCPKPNVTIHELSRMSHREALEESIPTLFQVGSRRRSRSRTRSRSGSRSRKRGSGSRSRSRDLIKSRSRGRSRSNGSIPPPGPDRPVRRSVQMEHCHLPH